MPKSFAKSIIVRNAVDLLLEFAIRSGKASIFASRRRGPYETAKGMSEGRRGAREVTKRVPRSNGWRTGKQKVGHGKKDRAGKSSHLPTPEASSLRSVDSDRTGY